MGLCCINLSGRSLAGCFLLSGRDSEDVEELVYETNFLSDAGLACEAMPAPDHTHDFKALDGSRRCLHRLKASGGTNDSFECCRFQLIGRLVRLIANRLSLFRRIFVFI
jgi:hypothetical protein